MSRRDIRSVPGVGLGYGCVVSRSACTKQDVGAVGEGAVVVEKEGLRCWCGT